VLGLLFRVRDEQGNPEPPRAIAGRTSPRERVKEQSLAR
jgi:hypothetical protein